MATTKRRRVGRKARPASSAKRTKHTGVITADEVLTIDAFCERLKISRTQLVEMRTRGLVARADGMKYVRIHGADYLEYVRKLPVAPIGKREPVESPEPDAAPEITE